MGRNSFSSVDLVHQRSGRQCEAMVLLPKKGIYTRCWAQPIEVHHLLTRARGGHLLDQVKEDYHLIALCHKHHKLADGKEAYEGNLLIDGYCMSTPQGKVYYVGSDLYLSDKYPPPKRTHGHAQ